MTLKVPKDKREVKELLEKAAEALFANQPDVYDFTSESGDSEWNLSHHYANEIHKFLPGYDVDLEIPKRYHNSKRPDIIFHKRGNNKHNFLVVEVKRAGNQEAIDFDIQKIKEHWFEGKLKYRFGASVNMERGKPSEVEVLENKSEAVVE